MNIKDTMPSQARGKLNITAKVRALVSIFLCLALVLGLAACGGGSKDIESSNKLLSAYPESDLTGYSGLSGYDKDTTFVDVTVKDIEALMSKKASFVVFAGFSNCPWCNALIRTFNDVCLEEGLTVAYLDTRRNPEWLNNMEIDDYDKFVEIFGEWIPLDDDNKKHLYVPEIFFVKDGKAIYGREGVLESLESPSDIMSEEQVEELKADLKSCIDLIR